ATTLVNQDRAGLRGTRAIDGSRRRRGPSSGKPGFLVRCVLHDEGRRHGYRPVRQPFDRRETPGTTVGRTKRRWPWRDVLVFPSQRPETDILTRFQGQYQSLMNADCGVAPSALRILYG